MKFKSPIQMGGVSVADDRQRCLVWSTALAAPQPATSVTLLLAILEAGRGTTAQRVLDHAGVTSHDLEPLELAASTRTAAGSPSAGGQHDPPGGGQVQLSADGQIITLCSDDLVVARRC